MSRGLVTSSRYSPGNLTSDALERTFVGRDALLTEVLGRVRTSITKRSKHYTLLVGARGAGKTHFMALLKARLCAEEHGTRMRIAALNEEEWGVASFLDFLVRVLRSLARAQPDAKLQAGIDAVYQAFASGEATALAVARSTLKEAVGTGTLVLLCENLADLFDGLGDEGQKRWRSALQEDGFWTVVATSPSLFAGVQLQTSPFYGFFTVRRLESLDFETGLQLLVRKARFDGHQDVAETLASPVGRARARAIHHLTGGNHRAYVIISDFLTTETLDRLVDPFMKMIDDLTPHYQDRMRHLAPFQRKIVEQLAAAPNPVSIKTIASRCLASPQSTAKQIGELDTLGFVRRNKAGRETLCELAEPLMRICFEVKDNRTEHLRLFIQFLRQWFSSDEPRTRLAIRKDAALRLTDRATSMALTDPRAAAEHAEDLLWSERWEDALAEITRARELGASVEQWRPLEAQLTCVKHGLRAACSLFARQRWPAGKPIAAWAASMMSLELQARGPGALAREVETLRALVERSEGSSAGATMLATFVRTRLASRDLADKRWAAAFPHFAEQFSGKKPYEFALRLLQAAMRAANGDESALLELPLEARSLVTAP